MSDAAFPFLFHGPCPDDWFDEPVHAWLLRFERAPSPAERASLAAAWERAAREHGRGLGADLALPWLWSDEWAVVQVRPGDRSRDTMRALFAAVQSMLRAAHEAAPLAEAVYAQAIDVSSDSAWEAWTVARSPVATAAPPWPADVVTHAKRSRKRSKAAVDASFEAARASARAGATAPKAAPAADAEEAFDEGEAPAGDEDEGDEDEGDDEPSEAEPVALPEPRGVQLRLVEVDREEAEQKRDAEGEAYAERYDDHEFLRDGTWIVKTRATKKSKAATVAVILDGEPVPTAIVPDCFYDVRAWSPERRELLMVSKDYRTLMAAPLDQPAGRVVWTDLARDSVNGALWLADGSLFVTHSRGASVYPPAEAASGRHHEWADECVLTPDRRGIVSCNSDEATVVRVVTPVGGALRVAGEACVATGGYASIELLPDGVYLFADERAYRVEGVSEAIDALRAAPGDAARFPELPAITAPEVLADPARNTDPDDCYNRGVAAWEDVDDPAAERWYRRAVELAPAHAMAWHGLGRVLQRMARDADARPCYERALAGYEARIAAETDDDERDELRFWRAATLTRLRRRDEALAALREVIAEGYAGNDARRRAASEEDFVGLADDAEFKALTAKVARPKRAGKAAKRAASDDDDA